MHTRLIAASFALAAFMVGDLPSADVARTRSFLSSAEAADFTGRIRRIRIKKRRVGSYRLSSRLQGSGEDVSRVAAVRLQMLEPFEGPVPEETVHRLARGEPGSCSGRGVCTFGRCFCVAGFTGDVVGKPYTIKATPLGADGRALAEPRSFDVTVAPAGSKPARRWVPLDGVAFGVLRIHAVQASPDDKSTAQLSVEVGGEKPTEIASVELFIEPHEGSPAPHSQVVVAPAAHFFDDWQGETAFSEPPTDGTPYTVLATLLDAEGAVLGDPVEAIVETESQRDPFLVEGTPVRSAPVDQACTASPDGCVAEDLPRVAESLAGLVGTWAGLELKRRVADGELAASYALDPLGADLEPGTLDVVRAGHLSASLAAGSGAAQAGDAIADLLTGLSFEEIGVVEQLLREWGVAKPVTPAEEPLDGEFDAFLGGLTGYALGPDGLPFGGQIEVAGYAFDPAELQARLGSYGPGDPPAGFCGLRIRSYGVPLDQVWEELLAESPDTLAGSPYLAEAQVACELELSDPGVDEEASALASDLRARHRTHRKIARAHRRAARRHRRVARRHRRLAQHGALAVAMSERGELVLYGGSGDTELLPEGSPAPDGATLVLSSRDPAGDLRFGARRLQAADRGVTDALGFPAGSEDEVAEAVQLASDAALAEGLSEARELYLRDQARARFDALTSPGSTDPVGGGSIQAKGSDGDIASDSAETMTVRATLSVTYQNAGQ